MEHKYFPSHVTGGHTGGRRVMKTVLLHLERRDNPAEVLGEPYGPWRNAHKRPRHRYTAMNAVPWMEQLEKLMLIDKSTGLVYHPPDHGFLTFDFVCLPRCPCPIQLINGSGQERLIQMIKFHTKERSSIFRMCSTLFMETYQLDEILESLESKFRKEAFESLLPCVRDTSNTWELMDKYAPNVSDRKNIQTNLRDMYYLCVNSVSGHYALDLSSPLDIEVSMRLAEISAHENSWCRRSNPQWRIVGHGHTAQKQNKSNFRNELYGRVPIESGLSDDFFKKGLLDKTMGSLEFDFVSISRPSLGVNTPAYEEDEDLKMLFDIVGYFSQPDDPQMAESRRAPSFLRDAVVTYKVEKKLNQKRNALSLRDNTLRSFQRSFSELGETRRSLLPKSLSLQSVNETKTMASTLTESPVEASKKAISDVQDKKLRKFDRSAQNLTALKKKGTSRELNAPKGVQSSLFSNFHLSKLPPFVKHVSDIQMMGSLVIDLESLLYPESCSSIEDIAAFAKRKMNNCDSTVTYLERVLTSEDLHAIQHDVENEISFFSCDGRGGVDRYQLNMSIRIVNDSRDFILEPVTMLRRTDDKKYELLGFELCDRSRASHNILEILGLNKDNSFYDTGLFSTQPSKMLPTHRRWSIYDDVMLVGSEIHVFLKVSDYRPDIIALKCREVVAKLFHCFGVTDKCVQIISHKSVEQKASSEFPQSRFGTDCIGTTHLVMHQLDVKLEGIAFTERALIKSSMDIAKYGAKPESIGCIWRWRPRSGMDRGTSKVEYITKSTHDVYGNKFFLLRSLLGSAWITCNQAKLLLFEFPQFGPDSQPYRESALLIIFSRIIDLENFHNLVEEVLPLDSHASVFNRIGWLNVLNGFQMDRFFQIDLTTAEQRLTASIVAKLAAVEPGQNCLEPHFRRSVNDNYSRGWDIPANWIVESPSGIFESVPHKGRFNVIYTSSPQKGCRIVPSIRTAVQERYLLAGVPRGDGSDIYLLDDDPLDWDDVF